MKRKLLIAMITSLLAVSFVPSFAATSASHTAKAKSHSVKSCRTHKDCKKVKKTKKKAEKAAH